MFYPSSVSIDKSGYNEYIRQNAPKKLDKIIDTIDDDEAIYGFTIGLPNSHVCCYDQLWLIDAGDQYIPVLIQGINTSSGMAMWSCGIYPDEDEEDQTEWSLDDLINFVGEGWRNGLRKVMEKEYINKKKEDSVEEIFSSL